MSPVVVNLPGAQFTEDDAFCLQADVEALVQRGKFTEATKPNHQQVLDWMARYAAQVESVLATAGVLYTVTSRGNPFPASTSDANAARLKTLCAAANAKAAAAEARAMHEVKDGTGAPSQSEIWLKEFEELLVQIAADCLVLETRAPIFSKTNTTDLKFLSDTEF